MRIAMIANPFSGGGKGRATAERVAARLRELNHSPAIRFTERPGHAISIAASLVLDATIDAVLVCGGDGSSHEAINGLALGALGFAGGNTSSSHLRIPPVILCPCGSGNTVAFNLGIRTWEDSIKALQSGCIFYTDLLECSKPEDYEVLPKLAAPAGGGGPRRRETLTTPVVLTGSGASAAPSPSAAAGAAGTGTPLPALDGATIAKLQKRLLFSFNMVGSALSTSVMKRANDLRWMGGAQYNTGALLEVIGNKSYLSCLQVVEPADGLVPVSADAMERARGELAAARAGLKQRKGFAGFITGSSNKVAEAALATATPAAATAGGAAGDATAAATAGSSSGGGDVVLSVASETSAPAPAGPGSPTNAGAATSSGSLLCAASPVPVGSAQPLLMIQIQVSSFAFAYGAALLSFSPSPITTFSCSFLLQPAAYMGSKMAFCPLSRLNDGLMDIATVQAPVSRLECIALMDAAKLEGEHVLGPKIKAAETSVLPASSLPSPPGDAAGAAGASITITPSEASSASASHHSEGTSASATGSSKQQLKESGMRYSQAKEIIFRPLDASETAAWLRGDDVTLPPFPLSTQLRAASTAPAPENPAEKAANFLRLCLSAPEAAATTPAAPLFPPVQITPAADQSTLAETIKKRKALNVAPGGMFGDNSVNVDGELSGFAPVRLRMLQRTLPVVCNPIWQGDD
jgi:diacylglycerol kinase family enzyme